MSPEEKRQAARAKKRAYAEANKERLAAARAAWMEKNREAQREYHRQYAAKNREAKAAYSAAWYAANRDEQLERFRANYGREREQRLAEQKAYREAHPVKFREARRRRTYGLSPEEQRVILAAHEDGCAICHGPGGTRGLFFDHDHVTGKVRGILCEACNTAIGRMKDDPARLRAAAEYVARGGSL